MYFKSDIAEKAYEVSLNDLTPHRTISRVPENPNYFEKDGLRTDGDGQDHEHEPPMTMHRFLAFTAMALLWSGSQIPLYLYGTVIPLIMADIGGSDRYVWILLGYLIPLAAVTPFVGNLSDLFGRKETVIAGSAFLILGNIITATSKTMNIFVAGMVFNGLGAGISELMSLAVTGEMAPTRKRGLYVGLIVISIFPYCPAALYSQTVSHAGSWRWLGLWCGGWSFLALLLAVFFFHPPPRPNGAGLTKGEIAAKIDYIGGILGTIGLTLFLMGLTWAGNQYQWHSPHVISTITIGGFFCVAFFVWEWKFAPHPMFPRRLRQNPKTLGLILFITFVSGANFFAVLVFWPTQYQFVYGGETAVSNALGSLPVGFCIIGGSVIASMMITAVNGRIKPIMLVSCIIMTAGCGGLAAATRENLNLMYIPLVFACLGVGAVIIPVQIVASIVCPDDLIGTVTAITLAVRVIGGSIGYAIYYNVLRQRFTTQAINYIVPACINIGIYDTGNITEIATLIGANFKSALHQFPEVNAPGAYEQLIFAGQQAYAASFGIVYYISIAFGVLACIAALFVPSIEQFMDGRTAVEYL